MEKFDFIPNETINFISCNFIASKQNQEHSASKFCPICMNTLGTIGILHQVKKVC